MSTLRGYFIAMIFKLVFFVFLTLKLSFAADNLKSISFIDDSFTPKATVKISFSTDYAIIKINNNKIFNFKKGIGKHFLSSHGGARL